MKTKYYQIGFTTAAFLLASFGTQQIASAQSGSVNVDGAFSAVGGDVSGIAGEAISGNVSEIAGQAISGGVSENIGSLGENTFFDNQGTSADFALSAPQNSVGQFDSTYESTPSGCCGSASSSSGCCGSAPSKSRCCGLGSLFSNRGGASNLAPRTLTILGGIEVGSEPPGFGFGQFLPAVDEELERYAVSLAIGRRHRNWLRTETELAFRSHLDAFAFSDLAGGFFAEVSDTDVVSLMRNVILEWNNSSRFTPYGGVGIGVSYINADSAFVAADGTALLGIDDNDTVFSWQAIAGVATKVRSNLDFVFEYRYFATADVTLDFFESDEFVAQNLFFGARLHF